MAQYWLIHTDIEKMFWGLKDSTELVVSGAVMCPQLVKPIDLAQHHFQPERRINVFCYTVCPEKN